LHLPGARIVDRAGVGAIGRDALAVDEMADRAHGIFLPVGRAQNRMCAIRGNTCRAADTVASSEGIRVGLWHTSRSLRRSATAVVVPQLRGDKYVLPLNYPCLEHLLHGIP